MENILIVKDLCDSRSIHLAIVKYEGWNFISGNYLFTTDTK